VKRIHHRTILSLLTMATFISAVGCSTVKPTPEASAAAQARPWGGSPPPTPEEQYPWGSLIINVLQGVTR